MIRRHFPRPRVTIEEAVDQFLEYQVTRVPGVVHEEYEKLLEGIKKTLNTHGVHSLNPDERAFFVGQRGKTFCQIFGPEKLLAEARRRMASVRSGNDSPGEAKLLRGLIRRLAVWLARRSRQ